MVDHRVRCAGTSAGARRGARSDPAIGGRRAGGGVCRGNPSLRAAAVSSGAAANEALQRMEVNVATPSNPTNLRRAAILWFVAAALSLIAAVITYTEGREIKWPLLA